MHIELVPAVLLTIIAVAGLVFLGVHWKYHPKQTQLDSFEALKEQLSGGKPALLQFHAPL